MLFRFLCIHCMKFTMCLHYVCWSALVFSVSCILILSFFWICSGMHLVFLYPDIADSYRWKASLKLMQQKVGHIRWGNLLHQSYKLHGGLRRYIIYMHITIDHNIKNNLAFVIVPLPPFNMRDVNEYSGRFHTFHHVSPGLSNLDRGFLADGSSCLFVRLIWYKHGDWGSHWRHHKLCLWNQVELCCSSAIPLKGYDSAEFEGLEKWERQRRFLPAWCFANTYIYTHVYIYIIYIHTSFYLSFAWRPYALDFVKVWFDEIIGYPLCICCLQIVFKFLFRKIPPQKIDVIHPVVPWPLKILQSALETAHHCL